MTYLKRLTLTQQQNELRKLIDKRFDTEESQVKERVYQWLNNNQYFVENELFDFYFSVAQNIAAIEILGGSGEKIVKAKQELELSIGAYTNQIVDTSNWINEQLQNQLDNIQKNQQKLDTKLIQVLEELTREHQNLKTVSTGLVNSTSVLLKKQKQLLFQVEAACKYSKQTIITGGLIQAIALLGCMAILWVLRQ